MGEEWIKGVFSDDAEHEYRGILHIRRDLVEASRCVIRRCAISGAGYGSRLTCAGRRAIHSAIPC